jgi:hypothetical protein
MVPPPITRVLPRRLDTVILIPFRVEPVIDDTARIMLAETVLPTRVET